jgi:hypothetical protein
MLSNAWGMLAPTTPVVPQDHRLAIAQVAHQALLLVHVDRHALVVVVADVDEAHRGLREGHQAGFHRRHRHTGDGVRVDHAIDLVPRAVDRAVDDEARLVDVVLGRVEQDLAVQVELDETRGVHLLVEHAVGIDEEGVVFARHAGRDVVGDHLVHAVQMDKAVGGGEIDALRPFGGADLFLDRFLLLDAGDAHGVLLKPVDRE